MTEVSVQKVNTVQSTQGSMGQRYLACGEQVAMRLWENERPNAEKSYAQREYETVGYVLKGRAMLQVGDQQISLQPGDSWVVPAGVSHCYQILESFTAVEATSPLARQEGRDRI